MTGLVIGLKVTVAPSGFLHATHSTRSSDVGGGGAAAAGAREEGDPVPFGSAPGTTAALPAGAAAPAAGGRTAGLGAARGLGRPSSETETVSVALSGNII